MLENDLALLICTGFGLGAMCGIAVGLFLEDFALGLSLGIGCGLIFGTGIYFAKKQKKQK